MTNVVRTLYNGTLFLIIIILSPFKELYLTSFDYERNFSIAWNMRKIRL